MLQQTIEFRKTFCCSFVILLRKYASQKQPPEVFYEKGVLRNFAKFTGKHLCQSLSFNEVGLQLY